MIFDFWFPWYPIRHQTKTDHLSCLEDGAYRRLIDRYMVSRQPLPDNDAALARIAGLMPDEWNAISATVRSFFIQSGGRLSHETCDEELDKQEKLSSKRSLSAQTAARARWTNGNSADARRMRNASDTHAARNAESMRVDATRQDKTEHNISSLIETEREVPEGAEGPEGSTPATTAPRTRQSDLPSQAGGDDGNRAQRNKSTLPEDWTPDQSIQAWAAGMLDPHNVDWKWELDKFRDHAAASGRKQLNWTGSFRNWIREAVDRAGRTRGSMAGRTQGKGIVATMAEVSAELEARERDGGLDTIDFLARSNAAKVINHE